MCWCITAVNRMLQSAKSQYGQPTRSVTQPSWTARSVNPKVNKSQRCYSQRSTQTAATKRQRNLVKSQRSTSISVPENGNCRNQNFDQSWGEFDHVLTKVNTGQLCAETLCQKHKFLLVAFSHVWMKKSFQVIEPIR